MQVMYSMKHQKVLFWVKCAYDGNWWCRREYATKWKFSV